jgi:hypothetical protein
MLGPRRDTEISTAELWNFLAIGIIAKLGGGQTKGHIE